MSNIVVVGSLNMDMVVRVSTIPAPGETVLGDQFATMPGGKGANQAVAAARLGARVSLIGRVGNDTFGEQLLQHAKRDGIDITHVARDEVASSGVAMIVVDVQGQNSIAVASGANAHLTSADVEKAMQTIGEFDALVMQLETPLEAVYTAARIASEKGAKVLLNPAPAQVLQKDLLQLVDVLVPNEYELALMTRTSWQCAANARRITTKMLSFYTAARIASRRSSKVVLNTDPVWVWEKEVPQLGDDVLAPNAYEVALTGGVAWQSHMGVRQAAGKILSLGAKNLLVTLGSQGAMLFNAEMEQGTIIPACTVQAVDTTAAGDCFVGAVAVGLCEGKSLLAAAEFAGTAAAISVTRPGAQPSLPHRHEVTQFIRERKGID